MEPCRFSRPGTPGTACAGCLCLASEGARRGIGAPATLTVLRVVDGEFSYRDADGNELLGNRAVETTHAIKDGEIYVI